MSNWLIRAAMPDDAANFIAYFKQIADEPNNGTTWDSAEQYNRSPQEQGDLIQSIVTASNSMWLLAVTSGGQVIGEVNCIGGNRARIGVAYLSISVAKHWRDQGIGTALMQRAIDWSRTNPVIYRLELEVITTNVRAIHVYEKLGFQRECVKHHSIRKHGQLLDTLTMAILFE